MLDLRTLKVGDFVRTNQSLLFCGEEEPAGHLFVVEKVSPSGIKFCGVRWVDGEMRHTERRFVAGPYTDGAYFLNSVTALDLLAETT